MPKWGEILDEIQKSLREGDPHAFDKIRTKYLKELAEYTGRDTIIYASRWMAGDTPPYLTAINDEDIHGFMEAISTLKSPNLDLILHTGGGSAESVEAIVAYLRNKFKHIRVIVPLAAMSAGTMLACAADVLVMGRHSFLGPIDPQFILQTSVGIQSIPAHAILEQFYMAQKDCKENPQNLNSWLPMLGQYGPALLVRCRDQIEFGKSLVRTWLNLYMFKNENPEEAEEIANYLSDHSNFRTHSKHINIAEVREIGLNVLELESDQNFQDRVLSAFHATMHLLGSTPTSKIIANHKGNVFIKQYLPLRAYR